MSVQTVIDEEQTYDNLSEEEKNQIDKDLLIKAFKDLNEDFHNFSKQSDWDSPDNFSRTELDEIQEYMISMQNSLNHQVWRDGYMSASKIWRDGCSKVGIGTQQAQEIAGSTGLMFSYIGMDLEIAQKPMNRLLWGMLVNKRRMRHCTKT